MGRRGVKDNNPSKLAAYDFCQTPGYGLDPIEVMLLSKKLRHRKLIVWESACGDGNLAKVMESWGMEVIATDINRGRGRDFFEWEPEEWDIQITNPPWSLKYKWLTRSISLKKPFGLLVPVKMLGGGRAQAELERITFALIFMSRRINFKTPDLGYDGHGATFPVMWITHHLADYQEEPEMIEFFKGPVPHAYPWERDLNRSLKKASK